MKLTYPLATPAVGARKIAEICKSLPRQQPSTINPDRHTPGPYIDIEVINKAYYQANQCSYEGFQEALKYGHGHGLFKLHISGARIIPLD